MIFRNYFIKYKKHFANIKEELSEKISKKLEESGKVTIFLSHNIDINKIEEPDEDKSEIIINFKLGLYLKNYLIKNNLCSKILRNTNNEPIYFYITLF